MQRLKARIISISFFALVFVGCGENSASHPFQRVVVTGASVTAGYGLTTPPIKGDLGVYPINLKHIVEAMIEVPHDEVEYFGNLMFFTSPERYGHDLVGALVHHQPSLVIAIDFLFWYAYGSPQDAGHPIESRMKKFERGLLLLEKIEAPILLGDIPDMHDAIGKMLSSRQVPKIETIEMMNTRLRGWAIDHPNITIVRAHDLIEKLMQDDEITIVGHTWPAGSQARLLQSDMLHPTLEGTVAFAIYFADALGVDGLQTDPAILVKHAAAVSRSQQSE